MPGIASHRTSFLFTNNEIVQFWLPNLRLIARVLSEVTKGPEMNPLLGTSEIKTAFKALKQALLGLSACPRTIWPDNTLHCF